MQSLERSILKLAIRSATAAGVALFVTTMLVSICGCSSDEPVPVAAQSNRESHGDVDPKPASLPAPTRPSISGLDQSGWKQLPASGDPFESTEINIAADSITITPKPNAWYQQFRGGLLYREFKGDFTASLSVTVSNKSGNGAPQSQFSLVGLLVRPNDAAETGTFIANVFGVTTNGQWNVQTMSSRNGQTENNPQSAPASSADLMIVRVGSTFSLLSRSANGQWIERAKLNRPDIPSSVQIGLMATTDWEACNAAGPATHNESGVSGGNPDLVARFSRVRIQPLAGSVADELAGGAAEAVAQRLWASANTAPAIARVRPKSPVKSPFAGQTLTPSPNPSPDAPKQPEVTVTRPPTQVTPLTLVAPPTQVDPPGQPSPTDVVSNDIDWTPDAAGYATVQPFFKQHCLQCHGPDAQEGDFRVDQHLPNDFITRSASEKWTEVVNALNAGEMPPDSETQPPAAETSKVVDWITGQLRIAEDARGDNRIVLRRMNREEYNNTIRDLIGVKLRPADEFPEDAPAAGFDNIGAALTISPLHMELYIKAAQDILDRAIVTSPQQPASIRWRFELEEGNQGMDRYRVNIDGQRIIVNAGNNVVENGMVKMRFDAWDRGSGFRAFQVPTSGEYIIRVRAASIVPPERAAREAGVRYHEHRQRETEAKLSGDELERRKRAYGTYVLPFVQKHFGEDRAYRYGPPRMKIDGTLGGRIRVIDEFDVAAPVDAPRVYETRAWFDPTQAGVAFRNAYSIPKHLYNFWFREHEDFPRPELLVDWAEIEGPVYDSWPPRSHTAIFIDSPNSGRKDEAYARDILANFMRRAFRRPLQDGELDAKVALFKRVRPGKPSFEEAIKVPLIAVLASPHFLYLVEEPTQQREQPSPLDDHELASRLSYFLWSSMPDDELSQMADAGRLRDATVLASQIDRMLADEKSTDFINNFSGQWLHLRDVGANPPAQKIYPRYDDHLEVSIRRESEEFFAHVLRNDLPLSTFLKSNFVTINERLARFYDIRNVKGDEFRVVKIPRDFPRGGLVTQASILSVTSNGTRTSPVDRGVWILENLLGDPPPPPPPNAGDIPPGVPGLDKATVRERLRAHREQPQCARCHNKIDPLGFALENFNAAGEWRTQEPSGNRPEPQANDPQIDASAQLPDGTKFVGVKGLQIQLLKRQDEFARCLTEKLFVYALGREVGSSDAEMIDDVVTATKQRRTLRALIHQVVRTSAFQSK